MFERKTRNPDVPTVEDVAPDEVWANRAAVSIIDVRRPDEFTGELGRVAGARLLTLDQLPQRFDELPGDQPIVFVCRSGGRSARAAEFARARGLNHVFNMAGGMLRWNELGLPVERGG